MQCLDENMIAALGAGRVDEARRANVLSHIASCVECRSLLVSVAHALPRTASWAPSPDTIVDGAPSSGAVIAERYVLDRMIGSGGAGVVWIANETESGERVALKFLRLPDAAQARRLAREARILQKLAHPAIVRVRELLASSSGEPILVMDYLEGESLAARLARENVLSLPSFAAVLVPVLVAVAHAHASGLVHRDLKPENIFLEAGAAGVCVKVLDFGLAKLPTDWTDSRSAPLTETGALVGTPRYMAPEQLYGQNDVDSRADVWAAATIAYRALSGTFPFPGRSYSELFRAVTRGAAQPIAEVAAHLPRDVQDVLTRALVVDREHRLADIGELVEVFRDHAAPSLAASLSRA